MGVIDEIKSHTPGRSSSSKSSSNDFNSDKFDGSFSSENDSSNSSFDSDLGSGDVGQESQKPQRNSGNGMGSQKRNQNSQQGPKRGMNRKNQTNNRNNSPNRSQRPQGQGGGSNLNTPNAQAGRPQEGSSKPQLSSQTEKKMQHAGMNVQNGRGSNQNRGSGDQPQTVAQNRDDFEELKSQNEQIIELLKRINRNLQGGGGRR